MMKAIHLQSRALLAITLTTVLMLQTACNATMPQKNMSSVPVFLKTRTHIDLTHLPSPKGKVFAAVYNFQDYTGQYKAGGANSLSTAVSQGGAAILTQAMLDSDWFIPVEREGLNNLLTERKIYRAKHGSAEGSDSMMPLLNANILLTGGIVAYESNVISGGHGAKYLGIGANKKYRTDQVTVTLRAVDIQSGRVLNSVTTTKTIYSYEISANVFRFVSFKKLLESEVGFARNEPTQLCVTEAIQAALISLIHKGIEDKNWALRDKESLSNQIFMKYIDVDPTQIGLNG